MVHISPWEATVGLIEHSAQLLSPGAPLILYGPYFQRGIETAPSNLAFDENLRSRDPRWGIRDIDTVTTLGESHGFALPTIHPMPANNIMAILHKVC